MTNTQPDVVQGLLDREHREVPNVLRERSQVDMGNEDIATARYISREFHAAEVEHMWRRTWQMACRVDDIPNVGDHVVYEVADRSVIVTRVGPDAISAYPNACLHRGTRLRETGGQVSELRCPFHGWCWELDGSLKEIPGDWDFPHVTPERFHLPHVQVATWQGFVFINMDPDSPSLKTYLGDLPRHFDQIGSLDNRWKAVHVGKLVRANWKVAQEAFLESYHNLFTHPQQVLFVGDSQAQYDIYPGEMHWDRMIVPHGVSSAMVDLDPTEQDIADSLQDVFAASLGIQADIELAEGQTAREAFAQVLREFVTTSIGIETATLPDTQMVDTITYSLFPCMLMGLSFTTSLAARFRPYGDDPATSIMDFMLLAPWPEDSERPPAAPMQLLGFDETFAEGAPNMPLGGVLDQDVSNMERAQKGLHSLQKGVTLGTYQESRIRHLHAMLDHYISGTPCP